MIENTEMTSYTKGSKFFHWFIAIIIIFMLPISFFLSDVPEQYIGMAFTVHKSLGITVLFAMLLRVLWIIRYGRPALPVHMPKWEKILAHTVQGSLYLFVILMPLCGWIMATAEGYIPSYFGLFSLPFPGIPLDKELASFMNQAHTIIAWIILGLLVLHVAGALKHHFIDKDDVLRRMLPKCPSKSK
ncbi:cytochrome b [Legionella dresdenensis]|uniref:Cytochrome b n=1 Tax=Legionella dresdenensis TaxID=450200 RepID=A0ABV8CH15_9GAMM